MEAIKTHYGNSFPLSKEEEIEFKLVVNEISTKLSIRNPNRREFVNQLKQLLK